MAASSPDPKDATSLMLAVASGDKHAADRLLPLVYEQLCKAAQRDLASERIDHTLCATALVHEAYLKLVGPREVAWANQGHFYAAAAQAMRRILIDHSRGRGVAHRARSCASGRAQTSVDWRQLTGDLSPTRWSVRACVQGLMSWG